MATRYNSKIVTDGLVLALDAGNHMSYPGSGTTWTDLSGRGNNGTLTNGPTFNSGNGGSIVFDGSNDYINLSAINNNYFSVQFWAKWNVFGVGNSGFGLISNTTSSGGNGFMIYQATSVPHNRLVAYVCTPNIVSSTTNTLLLTNTWYNFGIIYDGSFIRCFVNAVLDFSVAQTGNVSPNPGSLVIGKVGYSDSFFYGSISQVSIYNRAISATEILQNYNATKARFGL